MQNTTIQQLRIDQIDKELISKLKPYNVLVETRDGKYNVDINSHTFRLNGKKCFQLHYKIATRNLMENWQGYIKNYQYNDPKGSIAKGRKSTDWCKGIILSKTGESKEEQFDYLVFLLLQIFGVNSTKPSLHKDKKANPDYLPTEMDFMTALKKVVKGNEETPLDKIYDQMEVAAQEAGHKLRPGWRAIIEEKIELWTQRDQER